MQVCFFSGLMTGNKTECLDNEHKSEFDYFYLYK